MIDSCGQTTKRKLWNDLASPRVSHLKARTGMLRVKKVFAVVVLIKCLCCAVESTKGLCSKTTFVGRSTEQ